MPAQVVDIDDFSLDLEDEVHHAAEALRRGELVVMPTETVYGIAVKLDAPGGLEHLMRLRGEAGGPLTPHLPDRNAARQYVGSVSEVGERLMEKLWPGPVAIIFGVDAETREQAARRMKIDPALIYNPDGQVVLRCPDDLLTRSVLRAAGQPTVLTRAGLSRGAAANHPPAGEEVPEEVSLILDAGATRFSKPSTVIRVDGSSWEIVRDGVYDRRIIEKLLRTTIMFICSGNTCRSPMAMALARRVIARHLGVDVTDLGEQGYDVISAGAFAMPGMKATPQAVDALAEIGVDLAAHRSQPLSVELIHRADLIVTMGRGHQEAVLNLVPSAAEKTVMLDPRGDIDDPIGADTAHYRTLAGELEKLLEARLKETVLRPRQTPGETVTEE